MNADRLIRMAINLLLRKGIRHLSKGKKANPKMRETGKMLRTMNRLRRF